MFRQVVASGLNVAEENDSTNKLILFIEGVIIKDVHASK